MLLWNVQLSKEFILAACWAYRGARPVAGLQHTMSCSATSALEFAAQPMVHLACRLHVY